eukprot:15444973-Alexandrium_andersonii.AAC.1
MIAGSGVRCRGFTALGPRKPRSCPQVWDLYEERRIIHPSGASGTYLGPFLGGAAQASNVGNTFLCPA